MRGKKNKDIEQEKMVAPANFVVDENNRPMPKNLVFNGCIYVLLVDKDENMFYKSLITGDVLSKEEYLTKLNAGDDMEFLQSYLEEIKNEYELAKNYCELARPQASYRKKPEVAELILKNIDNFEQEFCIKICRPAIEQTLAKIQELEENQKC